MAGRLPPGVQTMGAGDGEELILPPPVQTSQFPVFLARDMGWKPKASGVI